jgi:hypothetical protein
MLFHTPAILVPGPPDKSLSLFICLSPRKTRPATAALYAENDLMTTCNQLFGLS